MNIIDDLLENTQFYKDLKESIKVKKGPILIYGGVAGLYPFLTSNISNDFKKPIIYLARDDMSAMSMCEDFSRLGLRAFYMPKRENFFFKKDATSLEKYQTRIAAINAIAENKLDVLLLSYQAMFEKFTPLEEFEKLTLNIDLNSSLDIKDLRKKLQEAGYKNADLVEGRGQFSIRGGIIDIYTSDKLPYRIELFGDEVDSIRTFDPNTQRSVENVKEIRISPSEEVIFSEEDRSYLKESLIKKIKSAKLEEDKQKNLEDRFLPYLDALDGDLKIENREILLALLKKSRVCSIFDYFKDDYLLLFEEAEFSHSSFLELKEMQTENVLELIREGILLKDHMDINFSFEQIREKINGKMQIYLSSLVKTPKVFIPKEIFDLAMRSVDNFRGRVDLFIEEAKYLKSQEYKIAILAGDIKRAKRLLDNLRQEGLAAILPSSKDELDKGNLLIFPTSVHEGFEFPKEKLAIINFNEIYKKIQKPKKKTKKSGLNFEDLNIGDYVVHESYGVGKYTGTSQMEIGGVLKDYISIEYRGDDRLFLPIDSLSQIYKYIGSEGKAPKLNKLNSIEWKRAKQKAKTSVKEMAEDLIKLYAARAASKGYQFSKDSPWQKDFEDAFAYEETEGQLESIEEIKKDMESPVPMDRLLCADVGYGKTEVALRACFKAVMDGKQVAFLCPTTILTKQHFATIKERFKNFPIEAISLSRFTPKKDQTEYLKRLKAGMADIVVGTHRILSKDVKFKDLGLLIVDEEQRFGVKDKEKLKMLKENVDTLTLTATPIPRTLQMSMVGIRDMSVIESPPEDRLPVQTYVLEYNDMMIRDAILKEISRKGQIYFLYNRVANMENKLLELKKLVPEARIKIANGQMDKKILEKTMEEFVQGEIDLLLCSTIIETGMDVPAANTLIVCESNKLGLSQLYQLRGRIGRSSRLAYAYFTYEKNTSISEVSEKRLRAIREFTEFGSGYKIALRDLEIRGSGNILGASQHGHMDSIGYDLYVKYLKDAVSHLKGQDVNIDEEFSTIIDLKIDSYIPKTYIENDELRMEIYKKIAILENDEDYKDLVDELFDRFGDLPRPLSNLMDIVMLKNMATKARILEIMEKDAKISINFSKDKLKLSTINECKSIFKDRIGFELGIRPRLILKSYKYPLEDIKKILEIVSNTK
ncbi:transcription-repair coupling factor [Peptoniphilus sp. GNH]|nr:transcription-repair coupling factor [Peptoniphilus sp. GNH]